MDGAAATPIAADDWRLPRLRPERARPDRYARVELAVFFAVLLAAALTPAQDAAGLPNAPLKGWLRETTGGGLCLLRRTTGVPCAGCGLTRGFVQMAHARPLEAVHLNPLTPLLFAWVLGRVAQALAFNLTGRRLDLGVPNRWQWRFYAAIGLGLVVVGALRIIPGVLGHAPLV